MTAPEQIVPRHIAGKCPVCLVSFDRVAKNWNAAYDVLCGAQGCIRAWKQVQIFLQQQRTRILPEARRREDKDGYVWVHVPDHPYNVDGWVREHRLVMEQSLGRLLRSGEIVHHRNRVRSDNRPQNLMLFEDNQEHSHHHWGYGRLWRRRTGGSGSCTKRTGYKAAWE